MNNRGYEFRTILARDVFTESVLAKFGLNERQLKAVKYVKEKWQINNQAYQQLNNTTKRTASRDLAVLVSLSIFKQTGVTGEGISYALRGHKGDISYASTYLEFSPREWIFPTRVGVFLVFVAPRVGAWIEVKNDYKVILFECQLPIPHCQLPIPHRRWLNFSLPLELRPLSLELNRN